MLARRIPSTLLLLLVFPIFASCSPELPPPDSGVSAEIGEEGGILRLPLVTTGTPYKEAILEIPKHALRARTRFTMRQTLAFRLADETPVSPAVELLPDGQQFELPVRLRMPFDVQQAGSQNAWLRGLVRRQMRTELMPIAAWTKPDGEAVLELKHLSSYQLVFTKGPNREAFMDLSLLVIMDNSKSMVPKQRVVAKESVGLFRKLVMNPATKGKNFRIGLITTDDRSAFVAGTPDCGKPLERFDNGKFQNRSCRERKAKGELSAAAWTVCEEVCPAGTLMPTDPFIAYNAGAKKYNVGMGTEAEAIAAFGCMAVVGDNGCNVEAPLEAMRRNLVRIQNGEPGYKEFLTLDPMLGYKNATTMLGLFFVTDEDDCSIRADRMRDNQFAARNCAATGNRPDPECFNIDYRCMAESVICGAEDALLSEGTKGACELRDDKKHRMMSMGRDSYLERPSAYVEALKSVLFDLDRVVVSGLWSPMIKNSEPKLGALAQSTPLTIIRASETSPATTPYLHHQAVDCKETDNGAKITAFPQLRLAKFACYLPGAVQVSICDLSKYGDAFEVLIQYINNSLMMPTGSLGLDKCNELTE